MFFFPLLPFLCFSFLSSSLLSQAEPEPVPPRANPTPRLRTLALSSCRPARATRPHTLPRGRTTNERRRDTSSFPPPYLLQNADVGPVVGVSEISAPGGDDLYDCIEPEGCKTCTLP
uniref:Uncharacterized protein n=1 Tax=Oryza nivara TaxID=4536 RepID=A0A0E0HN56_ORYNI